MKPTKAERAALKAELSQTGGNIRQVARNRGTTRAAVDYLVNAAGLAPYAAKLRAAAGISGGRKHLALSPTEQKQLRRKVETALKRHGTQGKAAQSLGMHRRRFQRAMERLGISAKGTP